jgi:hypothetical protein
MNYKRPVTKHWDREDGYFYLDANNELITPEQVVEALNADTVRAFQDAIKNVDERWLADECDASIATVRLWKSGGAIPTPTVQHAVMQALENRSA